MPDALLTVTDFAARARERMDAAAWDYYEGELSLAMALAGCRTLGEVTSDRVAPPR